MIKSGAALLVLAGCAGQMIKTGTDQLVGQPLSAAITKLGVPTEERTIAGNKVYIWTTSTVFEGTQAQCTIRAIMKGDVIGSFDWEGNEGRAHGTPKCFNLRRRNWRNAERRYALG